MANLERATTSPAPGQRLRVGVSERLGAAVLVFALFKSRLFVFAVFFRSQIFAAKPFFHSVQPEKRHFGAERPVRASGVTPDERNQIGSNLFQITSVYHSPDAVRRCILLFLLFRVQECEQLPGRQIENPSNKWMSKKKKKTFETT
ncbi:cell division septal protein [Anopheles sinensis]|uniref:Cell division septal protein n=1 Tax=Anopheles sinensis TaxID=74873 RepID=A0A084WM11_ANOSI|nr:cell division septal protein [Anopheles sinensis]